MDNAPDTLPTYRPNGTLARPAHWFAQLSEYLPHAYITANAGRLALLREDGCTPHAAAIYCRAYGLPAKPPAEL